MDKRIELNWNKKYIYYGVVLILFVLMSVIGIRGLVREKDHQQTKYESVLPGKATERASETIRVLIKSNGFEQIVHNEIKCSAETGMKVTTVGAVVPETDQQEKYEEQIQHIEPEETITIMPDDPRFQNGTIRIEPEDPKGKILLESLTRGYGNPSYRGKIELCKTAEGIVLINELKVEEYLYAVVPSEMPASYEMEALKAQAVCARSYAYNQSRAYAYPEYQAHVDDSTSFQVYGNSREQESTIRAVDETYGKKVWYNGQVATTYYYSTSSGRTTTIEAWGKELNESNSYLQSIELVNDKMEHYEKELPWYRWTATIPKEKMEELVELNTGINLGELKSVTITERGAGEIAQTLTVEGTDNTVVVETENKIRSALGGRGYQIERQDGTVVDSSKLLPSAFFTITFEKDSYIIEGGGYGHGIGMSQNGANEMAKSGKNYEEILTTFYKGVEVR